MEAKNTGKGNKNEQAYHAAVEGTPKKCVVDTSHYLKQGE
jgi:hypothetical protein